MFESLSSFAKKINDAGRPRKQCSRLTFAVERNHLRAFAGGVPCDADDRRAFLDAREDLEPVAVVSSDAHLLQVDGVVRPDHRQLRAVGAKDER